jgi:hypothetical protein
MKNLMNGFIKNLRYVCLIGVIAFGLISIVGSNGSGDGGAVDVSGYWKIWHTEEGVEVGPEFWTISQSGNDITITDSCDSDDDPLYGSIDGTSISFSWTSEGGLTTTATGTVSGDTMSGTWSESGGNSGTWRAEKTLEPECVPSVTPPTGAEYAYLPEEQSFDFSADEVDPDGIKGDFEYHERSMFGLAAPSGISWWTGNDITYFESLIDNPSYLPPPEGWHRDSGTSGSEGSGTRWIKTEENQYAMIFSISAVDSGFEFFYVYPYGNYTWSDAEAPAPPVLLSVDTGGAGEIIVQWQHSSSSDVAGYWVGVGENGSGVLKHAGFTTTYTLTDLNSGELYDIWLYAYDEEGNQSDDSNVLTGTAG